MSTREERVRVFTDTQSWIETDDELSAAVNYSKKHTKIYWEDDYPKFNRSRGSADLWGGLSKGR